MQTRYYDPEVGRFISQDSVEYADPETINGLNLYAYCLNNPVMNVDPTGEFELPNSQAIDIISALFEFGIGLSLSIVGHSVKTGVRPNNIGVGKFNKYKASYLGKLSKASNILSKVSTALAIASVVMNVVDGIKYDMSRGYSEGRIASNAITNVVIYGGLTLGAGAIGSYLGSLVGSVVPGLGNVVGAAVGYLVGIGVGYLLDLKINGKSVIDHIRDGVYYFWKWLFG